MILKRLLRSQGLGAVALTIAIVALMTLLWQSDELSSPAEAEALWGKAEPDSFIAHATFLSFAEDGRLATKIESRRVEQFEKDDLVTLHQPRAKIVGDSIGAFWQIEAADGRLIQNQDLMLLAGEVRVSRVADSRNLLSLTTQALTLNNTERTAYTSKPVTITESLGVTRAVGMKAWIDSRILELNAQVGGEYEPGN